MNRTMLGSQLLLWLVVAASIIAVIASVTLALLFASDSGLLWVPFASWFVFGLGGLLLAAAGLALFFWRRLRRALRELSELSKEPLAEELPAVYGHQHLEQAEFLPILQSLFGHTPAVKYVHVTPLPGGYGGSTTVLAELQREPGDPNLPRAFAVKLGDRREMADEYDKFHNYVLGRLGHAAKFFRHAEWDGLAGIAYEFVGLDADSEIRSFHQFYQGYATVEVAALIEDIYAHLRRAWYKKGRLERANLYQEYDLLSQKREQIIGRVEGIVDEDDSCRVNLAAVEARLRPQLRPNFCPLPDIPWYDPVAFLRMWPSHSLQLPIYQSTVHGDLHARNVLVETGRDGRKRVWFIDFSHTGNGLSLARSRAALQVGLPVAFDRGHTLRDFCRLEADVKFILTRLHNKQDLGLAVAFEKELLANGLALYELPVSPPSVQALGDERFQKAWQVIREIRRRAAAYLASPDDLRPYYLSLLHATLPIVYYHPAQFENKACELQQKRYAFIAAGMLSSQL